MLSEDVAWSKVGRPRRIDVLPEGRCASIGWIVAGLFNGLSGCVLPCMRMRVRNWIVFIDLLMI